MLMNERNTKLCIFDFPFDFVDGHHPDDYKLVSTPIKECIWNGIDDYYRLLLRISIKLGENEYKSLTFICNTGAPDFIYLNEISYSTFKDRLIKDENGFTYIKINNRKFPVKRTHYPHNDFNILGVRALAIFKMKFTGDYSFDFQSLPDYF
jgi:hypothetical protein